MFKFSLSTLMLIRGIWLVLVTVGYSAWFVVNHDDWNRFIDAWPVVATLALLTTMCIAATIAYIPYSAAFTNKFWNRKN